MSFCVHFWFAQIQDSVSFFFVWFCQREDYMQEATTQTAFVTHQHENTKGSNNNKRGKKKLKLISIETWQKLRSHLDTQ